MKLIWRIFLAILKGLNYWLFVLPNRFSFLAMGVNFLIIEWFQDGRPIHLLERDLRSKGDFVYFAFMVCFAFPMFWAFLCCWSDAKMTSSKFRKSNTNAIDRAIEYRNGQVGIQTPRQAFETMKKTAVLDQISTNNGIDAYDKALQGFNADFGNKTPQEIFNKLSSNN